MKLQPIERKWWFFTPVIIATVCSMYWMFFALGLEFTPTSFSFPKWILFISLFSSFERFYSLVFQKALIWFSPPKANEKTLTP